MFTVSLLGFIIGFNAFFEILLNCLLFCDRPRVSIIGSREQLCVNNEVLKQDTNSAKVRGKCVNPVVS